MALMGYEWLVVVAVIVVIFLWGPQKLPQLARAVGQAKSEFDKASKEATSSIEKTITSTVSPSTEGATAGATPVMDPIIVAAKSLGINTEGLTKEELGKKILGLSTK